VSSYRGDVVTYMASLLPDVHRELLRVHESGNLVVAELLIQGTFLGPLPTPAGLVMPNIMMAQMGVDPDFASAVKSSAAVG
jgi:hypothetical protein